MSEVHNIWMWLLLANTCYWKYHICYNVIFGHFLNTASIFVKSLAESVCLPGTTIYYKTTQL